MSSSSSRIAAVAGLLLGTWSVASAEQVYNATPSSSLDHFRTVSVNFNEATSAVEEIRVSDDFGAIAAGTTGSLLVPNLVILPAGFFPNSLALGLGTTSDGGVVLNKIGDNFTGTFSSNFPQSSFVTLRDAIVTGDVAGITGFFAQSGSNPPAGRQATFLRSLDGPSLTLTKFSDTSTAGTPFGSATYEANGTLPVPEPASMAVLGLGLAALKRRRKG